MMILIFFNECLSSEATSERRHQKINVVSHFDGYDDYWSIKEKKEINNENEDGGWRTHKSGWEFENENVMS